MTPEEVKLLVERLKDECFCGLCPTCEAAAALTLLAQEREELRTALRDVLTYAQAGQPPIRLGEMTVTEKASRLLGGKCVDCGGLPDDHQANYYCAEFRAVARSALKDT